MRLRVHDEAAHVGHAGGFVVDGVGDLGGLCRLPGVDQPESDVRIKQCCQYKRVVQGLLKFQICRFSEAQLKRHVLKEVKVTINLKKRLKLAF